MTAVKENFYSELHSLLQSIPTDDKILIPGDFNVRVGQNAAAWKGILSRHGIGNCSKNGRLLMECCLEQQLVITNSIFRQKDSLITTWRHLWSEHWHFIDYVLARQQDLKDVLHTKVMPNAECHTDHCKVSAMQTQNELQSKTKKWRAILRKSANSACYRQLK